MGAAVQRFRVPEIVLGALFGSVLSLFVAGVGSYQAGHCEQAQRTATGQSKSKREFQAGNKTNDGDHRTAEQGKHPPYFGCGALGFVPSLIGFMDSHEGFFVGGFTLVLAIVTAWLVYTTRGLRDSTDKLWDATIKSDQARGRETQILQRAYVTVLPGGIEPYKSGDHRVSCDVIFVNSGNLPATKVRWRMERCFQTDAKFIPPSILDKEWSGGTNVIPPKGRMRKGAKSIQFAELDSFHHDGKQDECWLYIWGVIEYRDGFRDGRATDFCHRYNVLGHHHRVIPPSGGRHHEHGNRTDET